MIIGPLTKLSEKSKFDKGYIAILIAVLPLLLIFVLGGGAILM